MQTAVALSQFTATRAYAAQTDTSDEALIRAIADGDKRAMHVLYARHNVRVYRFVLRMTGREALAEDITSEVFLEVWRQADRFQGRSQASTWLLGIARYKAISAIRRRQDGELNEESLALIEDPADNPEEFLEKSDRSALVRKCLAKLSPAHREIIDLVYYHEKSVADAAAIIDIPQATVKTRMFYARAQLAHLIRQTESRPVMS
jgi:RNA polymerase sigma-70 factor (ECF subfamily)